jgi:hypothetical protein
MKATLYTNAAGDGRRAVIGGLDARNHRPAGVVE